MPLLKFYLLQITPASNILTLGTSNGNTFQFHDSGTIIRIFNFKNQPGMPSPIWFVNFLKAIFTSRNIIAKLTKVAGIGDLIDYTLFRGDHIIYLPKSDILEQEDLDDSFDNIVLPSKIVEYFINKSQYHWIMDFCICRQGENCQEFPKDLGCLFLGDAVLKINPKLGRLVSRDEAFEHVSRCRDSGLVHMVGRNRLDTVWLGVGPSENLLTICNCCPCCCLWRMIPYLSPRISNKVRKIPGITVYVSDDCNGCGICADDMCFVDAIRILDNHAVITEECRGCGRCVENCPSNAIKLYGLLSENIIESINLIDKLVTIE